MPASLSPLEQHYDTGAGLYKLWASPRSVLAALLLGWRAVSHPAQLHYGWDLDRAENLDAAIRQTTLEALRWLDFGTAARPRVLDAGCGIGGATCQLAQHVPHIEITGLTIVARQVELARARARALGLGNVDFGCASYLDTPFEDASFDGIFAIESFCYTPTPQKPALLAEMLRVLRPGRRLVIVDGVALREPANAGERIAIQSVLDGWTMPMPTPAGQLSSMAAQAGFDVYHVEDVTRHVLASADRIARIGERWLRPLATLARWPGMSGMLAPLGMSSPTVAARFADACVAQREVLRSGLGGYFVHVLRKPDAPSLSTAEPHR